MNQPDSAGQAASNRIKAVLAGLAGSFILFAAYLAFPPVGIFSGLVAPLPLVVVHMRYGIRTAVVALVGGTAALSGLFGISAGLFYLVQCGLISLLMTGMLLRGTGGVRSLAWTSAANLVLLSLMVVLFSIATGQDINKLVTDEIRGSVSQAVAIYEKGGVKGEELAKMRQAMNSAADVVIRMYPALVSVTLIGMAGLNLALIKRFFAAGGSLKLGDFASYRTPDVLVWLLIAAGFSLLSDNRLITTPALNVLTVLLVLYFLQGFAVLLTIIARQSVAAVLRVALYVMLIMQPYLTVVVAVIGIFDLWGDFRTPRKQENL